MQWFSKADPHTCSICVTWELPERQIPSPYSSHTEWETLGAGPCHLLLTSTARVWWVLKFESILKEISPGCSLEGMMLKPKLQYFGHLMQRVDSLEKTDAGNNWRQEEKGTAEDEIPGWHHCLDGCEFEWTLGDGDGQGGLACCNSWGRKESDMTERLNWTELIREIGILP